MVIGNTITIQNKLEVLLGNKILVPGCEPTSAFTSPTLAENRVCNASVISLSDALTAIPGSTIEEQKNPRRLYFVLPSGPPPAPNATTSVPDHYAALRALPADTSLPKTIVEIDTSVLPTSSFTIDETGKPVSKTTVPAGADPACSVFPLRGIF